MAAARVAVRALAAAIREIDPGSGVILLYKKVLKNWFSTAHAREPTKPSDISENQTLPGNLIPEGFVIFDEAVMDASVSPG